MTVSRLVKKTLGPAVGLLLFSAALWVLSRELHAYQFSKIMHAWEGLPYGKFFAAMALTVVNYAILTGYDFLALRFIKNTLAYHKVAFASFIGYAFSNNFGASMIAGATVRFRLYSGFGLSALDITRIIGFCTMTVWIGFFCPCRSDIFLCAHDIAEIPAPSLCVGSSGGVGALDSRGGFFYRRGFTEKTGSDR